MHVGVFFENAGAFVSGGSGGEDVIDQDDIATLKLVTMMAFDLKGSPEIGKALLPVQFGLSLRATFSDEGVGEEVSAGLGELASQFVGLIPVPPLMAPPVKGNGDQEGLREIMKALVFGEGFVEKSGETTGEVKMALVFQPVNQVEGLRQTFQGGPGEVEIVFQAFAVLTGKPAFEGSVEGLAASVAEGRGESGELFATGLANREPVGKRGMANFTHCRVEEIEKFGEHRRGWILVEEVYKIRVGFGKGVLNALGMKRHQWRENEGDEVRYWRANYHGGRFELYRKDGNEEEWERLYPPSTADWEALREVLWRKYQRKRCPWNLVAKVDKILGKPNEEDG